MFVHVGKTAGTAVREAIGSRFAPDEVCPYRFFKQFDEASSETLSNYRFFAAHIGFDTATELGTHIVTVLRDPVDRVLSLYYYWRDVAAQGNGRGPTLAKTHRLEEFLELSANAVVADVHNTQTWQLAYAHDRATRELVSETRSLDDVYRRAISNLERFDVVGVQENLGKFVDGLRQRYEWHLPELKSVNVTPSRRRRDELTLPLRRRIHELVAADLELYAHVTAHYARD